MKNEEIELYSYMSLSPFTKIWHFWAYLIFILLVVVFSIVICYNDTKTINDDSRKYEITSYMGIIGYIHYCDRYEKRGTIYLLYKDNKLSETIDTGSAMIVIKTRFN